MQQFFFPLLSSRPDGEKSKICQYLSALWLLRIGTVSKDCKTRTENEIFGLGSRHEETIQGEAQSIAAVNKPSTIGSLVSDLIALGMNEGMTLLVHSSLRSLGWVCGGPVSVILALEQVLGTEGTLVMPTHSSDLSEPSVWKHPPVPKDWWQIIRRETPAFRPDLTPTRQMGTIAESFRKQHKVLRSSHPQASFAAWGKNAEFVTSGHSLEYSLGEKSPLARIYDLDGYVLLLGITDSNNTSIHVSEYRSKYSKKKVIVKGAPISLRNGERDCANFEDINIDDSDFERIGADFASSSLDVTVGKIGNADSKLMRQRELVDFGVRWIEQNRNV